MSYIANLDPINLEKTLNNLGYYGIRFRVNKNIITRSLELEARCLHTNCTMYTTLDVSFANGMDDSTVARYIDGAVKRLTRELGEAIMHRPPTNGGRYETYVDEYEDFKIKLEKGIKIPKVEDFESDNKGIF